MKYTKFTIKNFKGIKELILDLNKEAKAKKQFSKIMDAYDAFL
jgi:hypothetical protein